MCQSCKERSTSEGPIQFMKSIVNEFSLFRFASASDDNLAVIWDAKV